MTKCHRLSELNTELQSTHIRLSEEWRETRQRLEAKVTDLQSDLEQMETKAREYGEKADDLEVTHFSSFLFSIIYHQFISLSSTLFDVLII